MEVERARLTKILSDIKEKAGNINDAADILLDLQVETYGSMEKREKTTFILEQMRLCLAKHDFVRTQILSKKINVKYFNEPDTAEQKLKFYELMIRYSANEGHYLHVCQHYFEVLKTDVISNDPARWKPVSSNESQANHNFVGVEEYCHVLRPCPIQ